MENLFCKLIKTSKASFRSMFFEEPQQHEVELKAKDETYRELKGMVSAKMAKPSDEKSEPIAKFLSLGEALNHDEVSKNPEQLLLEVNELLSRSVSAGWKKYESAIEAVRKKWLADELKLEIDVKKYKLSVEGLLTRIWAEGKSLVDGYIKLLDQLTNLKAQTTLGPQDILHETESSTTAKDENPASVGKKPHPKPEVETDSDVKKVGNLKAQTTLSPKGTFHESDSSTTAKDVNTKSSPASGKKLLPKRDVETDSDVEKVKNKKKQEKNPKKSFTAGFAQVVNWWLVHRQCVYQKPLDGIIDHMKEQELQRMGVECRSQTGLIAPFKSKIELCSMKKIDDSVTKHAVPVIFSGFRINKVEFINSEMDERDFEKLIKNHKPDLEEIVDKARFRQGASAVFYGRKSFGSLRSNVNPYEYFKDKNAVDGLRELLKKTLLAGDQIDIPKLADENPINPMKYILTIDRFGYKIELTIGVEYYMGFITNNKDVSQGFDVPAVEPEFAGWKELNMIKKYFTVEKLSVMNYEEGVNYAILSTGKRFPEEFSRFAVVPQITTKKMKKMPVYAWGHVNDVNYESVSDLLKLHPVLFYNLALCAVKTKRFQNDGRNQLASILFEGLCDSNPKLTDRVVAIAKISLMLILQRSYSPAKELNHFVEFLCDKYFKPLFRCNNGQIASWGIPFRMTYLSDVIVRDSEEISEDFDSIRDRFNRMYTLFFHQRVTKDERKLIKESPLFSAFRKLNSMNITTCVEFLEAMKVILKNPGREAKHRLHPISLELLKKLFKFNIVKNIKVEGKKDELVQTIELLKNFAYPHKSAEEMIHTGTNYVKQLLEKHKDSESEKYLFDASVHKGMEGCQISFEQMHSGKEDRHFHRKFFGLNLGSSEKHPFRNEYLSVGNETVLRLYYHYVVKKKGPRKDSKDNLEETLGYKEEKDIIDKQPSKMVQDDLKRMKNAFKVYAEKARKVFSNRTKSHKFEGIDLTGETY